MNTRIFSSLVLCLCIVTVSLSFAACEKAKQTMAAGTYVSERNPKHTRELKSDGTVVEMDGGRGVEGTYEISGSEITFRIQVLGTTQILKSRFEGNAIVDGDGERLVKR